MSGKEAIEEIVRGAREDAENEVMDFGGLSKYADALQAEAALPDRRPEWQTWARDRAKALRGLAERLDKLLGNRAP